MIGPACIGAIAAATQRAGGGGGGDLPVTDGLLLWFDSSDAGTIAQSGGLVSAWADKSGNGNHATSYSSTYDPSYLPSAVNGHGIVDFGPYAATWSSGGKKMKYPAVSGKTFILSISDARPGGFLFSHSSAYSFHRGGAFGANASNALLHSVYSSAALRTGSADTRRNGVSVDPTSVGLASGMQTIVFRTDGTALAVNCLFVDRDGGFADGGSSLGGGYVGDVLVFDDVLSTSDVELIEGYLFDKWGIS